MSTPQPKTNGDSSLAPFDGGSRYESWYRLAEIRTMAEPQVPAAVILEAPEGFPTAQPYAFLHLNHETGQLSEIVNSDRFLLAINIAHIWESTEVLDDLEQADIAGLLASMSLPCIDTSTARQIHTALTLGLGIR